MRTSTVVAGFGAVVAIGVVLLGAKEQGHSRGGTSGPRSGSAAHLKPPKNVVAAKNASHLILMKDDHKVVGWVSGARSYHGWRVKVHHGGRIEQVKVGRDNTFRWAHTARKPTRVRFSLGRLQRSITLEPPADRRPSAFFVVDRPVYRPGQALHFAGFLRRMDPRGGFAPIRDRAVEVRVTSIKKKTVAARLGLRSDKLGRILGSYRFMEADPLDDYKIAIAGYAGSARVKLAEFRKSKVKLVIKGKVRGHKLRLRFAAVDFVGKPVAGTRVELDAQVVRAEGRSEATSRAGAERPMSLRAAKGRSRKPGSLRPARFVYAVERPDAGLPAWHELAEEERLLISAGAPGRPDLSRPRDTVLARVKGQVALDGKTSGHYDIDLDPAWLREGHSVRVKALVVDGNGREQRAYRLLSLRPEAPRIDLALDQRVYAPGEPVQLTLEPGRLKATSTLVVMRLRRQGPPESRYRYGYGPGHRVFINNIGPNARLRRGSWSPVRQADTVGRSLTTARPITGRTTTVRLTRPGAYKLVVITRFAGGETARNEVGCVVRHASDGPALALKLDRTELAAGGRLTGEVVSRFTGARLLLSIYDGAGIRLWRPLALHGNRQRIDLRLPRDLGYGAVVDVQYADRRGCLHLADAFFRVRQDHRAIKITTEMDEQVTPGKEVGVKIKVNRSQPVDLVLAVHDQSLLGIAPDRSTDPRDFYLADARARDRRSRMIVERLLGHLTLDDLLRRARRVLKSRPELQKSEDGRLVASALEAGGRFYMQGSQLVALLRLNGVDARWAGHYWNLRVDKKARRQPLASLLRQRRHGARVTFQVYDGALVLAPRRPGAQRWSQRLWRGPRHHRARGDARHSVSGNAVRSVSGQAFISHAAPRVALLRPEGGSAHRVRKNFSDLAYWNATVRTDARGEARVAFKVPDSLTNWRVVVTAISREMHVGRHVARFRTFKPVMVWPMLPRVFTDGDRVKIFARVHNRTDRARRIRVGIKVKNGRVLSPRQRTVRVAAGSSLPVYWTFEPGAAGHTQILMTAEATAGSDASLKRLPVVAAAAEQRLTRSGFAEGQAVLELPREIDLASARLTVTLMPSLAADLVDNLDYLVQYPYGCVEQTMSRFLPAIKVARTLERFRIEHPGLQARLPRVVAAGIKRLLDLQKADGGWGWHGQGRTHEMMTPYALFGLLQAERAGYQLGSEAAVRRGLSRLRGFIRNMGPAQAADRIYAMVVYSHRHAIEKGWWEFIEGQLERGKLSDYALALALEMAVTAKRRDLAVRLARALRRRAVEHDGQVHWRTAGFSRWGDDKFEITAAALKALVAHDITDKLIPGALAFFAATKRGNRWNSTKDTAMITFAIADYLARQKRLSKGDGVVLTLNGGEARRVAFKDGLKRTISLPASALRHGENRIRFLEGSRTCLYRAVLRHRRTGRHIRPMNAGIAVARRFYLVDPRGKRATREIREIKPGATVPRGSYILSEVEARGPRAMRYVLVESPRPSGCEVLPRSDDRFDQTSTPHVLREDRTARVAFHHESTPSRIVNRAVFHAEFAGEFVVAPAAAELMYQTRTRGHSGTFHFKVGARGQGV